MKNKMTRILSLSSLFIIVMFSFATCKKSDTTTTTTTSTTATPPAISYYFTCKVDGVFTDFKNQTLIKDNPANIQTIYLVGGVSAQNTPPILNFNLTRKGNWAKGLTYKLDDGDLVNFSIYKSVSLDEYKSTAVAAASGGITISFSAFNTTKDSAVTGTFSGTLQLEGSINTVVITEGKFNVKFQN